MKTHLIRIASYAAIVSLFAGCGGGGGGNAIPSNPMPTPAKTAKVTVTVKIPRKPNSVRVAKKGQRPYYVSTGTNSFTITVLPGPVATTVPCVGTMTTTCSGYIDAPLGADTFTVNLYDGTSGNGNLLSASGSVPFTVVEGVANVVNMTFNPVVSSLHLALSTTNERTDLNDAGFTVTLNAEDADGDIIVGPGSYIDANNAAISLNLTDNDALSRFPAIAGYPLAAPPTPSPSLPYTAVGDATPVVFTASVTGSALIANATATLTFTQVIHIQPQGSETCATALDGEPVCGFSSFPNGSTAAAFSVPVGTLVEFVNDDTVNPRNIVGIGELSAFPASITNPNTTGSPFGSFIDTTTANSWATGTLLVPPPPSNTSGQFGTDTVNSGNRFYFGDTVYYAGPPVLCSGSCSVGSYLSVH